GETPFIAEDLGVVTPEVTALRKQFNLPGMRVIQYGFGGDDSVHRPDLHESDNVIYAATHDSDTARGWYRDPATGNETRRAAREFLQSNGSDISWDLINAAEQSVGDVAIVEPQDMLGLGSEARMNVPGTAEGNWGWRLESAVPDVLFQRL